MGLEIVQIVLSLEEEFDIRIPDKMVEMMMTVGHTSQEIVELLKQKEKPAGICFQARSFYRLRRELVHRFEMERRSVGLDVQIGAIVPRRHRDGWRKVADAAGLRREPYGLFKNDFPPAETSVRELIQTRCKDFWRRLDGSIDDEAVYRRVRRIVSEQLNVPADQITKGSHYYKDLGCG